MVVGGQVHDSAVLANDPIVGAVLPTGTLTYTLFGPDDSTCALPPVFESTVPVVNGGVADSTLFTPTAAGTYRWRATYSGDSHNHPAGPTGCDDRAEAVVVTPVAPPPPPSIRVSATAEPLTLPEPGGTFAGSVAVTNTGVEPLTLTGLSDEDLNGVGSCSVPQTLAPGAAYSCTFPIVFVGNAGDTRTVPVTATVIDAIGRQLTSTQTFVLTLSDALPTLTVTKVAEPTTMPAPGGRFTYRVAIVNTSAEPVRLVGLTDDIHGDLNASGNCKVGGPLAAGGTYGCSFEAVFMGVAGDRETDTVTATIIDDEASTARASGSATVTLSPATMVPTVPPSPTGPALNASPVGLSPSVGSPLARTGTGVAGYARLAAVAIVAGALMLGVAWPHQGAAASTTISYGQPRRRRSRRR